jgi:hypothetical protein
MLLRTLFISTLLAVVAETIVHGAHARAQASLRRTASSGVQRTFETATTAAQAAIASAVEAGGDPQTIQPAAPAPSATCVLASQNGCALEGRATIAFQTPAPQTSPCASGACTVYEQGNDTVAEWRTRAAIAVEVVAAGGAVLASRSEIVAFRTFRVAPYAALVGSLDGSVQRLSGDGAGDDAGAVPNGTAPGSLIDVIYENRTNKKTIPANVWRAQVQNSGSVPEAWSP